DQIALSLEGRARVIRPRVKNWRPTRSGGLCSARAIPGDVNPTASAHRQVRTTNGAESDSAARLAVHANRLGKRRLIRSSPDVEHVAALGRPAVVDQVKG